MPKRSASTTEIVLVVLAGFGAAMAAVVPMAFTLAVRVDQLAPGNAAVLGYILSAGAVATLIAAPLAGVLSDRLRSRWGRRRPFCLLGVALGLVSLPVMIGAQEPLSLAAGWMVSTVGWSTATSALFNWQADRLHESQRGKVAGLAGMASHSASVVGILIVGPFSSQVSIMFLVPALVATVLTLLWMLGVREADTRSPMSRARLTVNGLLSSYVFSPKAVPDFAWAWLGRFLLFMGITLTSSFGVFFYAQRLDLPISNVAGVLALTSALSLVSMTLGSLSAGWLSDVMARRKPLILAGAIILTAGSVVSAGAYGLTPLIVGSFVSALGIAVFTAVSQALVLDVLPNREHEAGRYMGIMLFSQKVPGALAPSAASLLLSLGGGENFTLLYLLSAALALSGGFVTFLGVRGTR